MTRIPGLSGGCHGECSAGTCSKDQSMNENNGTVLERAHRGVDYYQDRPTHETKVEFPMLDGSCVHDWIFKSERLIELDATPTELKVSTTSIYIVGLAMDWHYASLKRGS